METFSINTIHDLIDHQISKFLSSEVELKNRLTKWSHDADSLQLKTILHKYLEFVNDHIKVIDDFIVNEQITVVSVADPIMLAFINETDNFLEHCANPEVRDACLLANVQGINHYKISTYGTASAFAALLEQGKYAAVFHEAEVNEKHIDDRLSQLAKFEINIKAKSPIKLGH